MDNLSKKERSYNMSRIRSSGTKPELVIEDLLRDLKVRFKKHYKNLPGKPDFYIPQLNAVILVHGCFWHAHKNCKYFRVPLSNKKYWEDKFECNKARDKIVSKALKEKNIEALTIWSCEIQKGTYYIKLLKFLSSFSKD